MQIYYRDENSGPSKQDFCGKQKRCFEESFSFFVHTIKVNGEHLQLGVE